MKRIPSHFLELRINGEWTVPFESKQFYYLDQLGSLIKVNPTTDEQTQIPWKDWCFVEGVGQTN